MFRYWILIFMLLTLLFFSFEYSFKGIKTLKNKLINFLKQVFKYLRKKSGRVSKKEIIKSWEETYNIHSHK